MCKGYLFFDYDGTLSNKMEHPTDAVIKALNDAKAAGYKIFICSGRCRAMLPEINGVTFDGYVLACGTDVRVGDTQIIDFVCDTESLRPFVELAIKDKAVLVTEGEKLAVAINGKSYWPKSPSVKNFNEFKEKYSEAAKTNKFSIMCPCGKDYLDTANKNGFIFIDHVGTGEFVPVGFSKETGINAVLKFLGADVSEVTAFGDSMNDYEMLKFAGTGIAMGNAVEGLKKVADHVALSCADDGVADYITKYLLK